MALDENLAHKGQGDPVRSADWNDLAAAVLRHETGKLDTTGGAVSGPLVVQGGLTAQALSSIALGVDLLRPAGNRWSFDGITSSESVIDQNVEYAGAVSLLVVGHGHASTGGVEHPMTATLAVDGVILGADSGNWGVGYLGLPAGAWAPIVAIGTCRLTAGSHRFELRVGSVDPGGSVAIHAPTMWMVRLGSS